jgi:flavin-binding protein dodecin
MRKMRAITTVYRALLVGAAAESMPAPRIPRKESSMTMLKVIEVLAQSNKSWEDAAQVAVKRAARTVKNIKSIYIKEMEAVVDGNKITQYRVNAKISFVLEGS